MFEVGGDELVQVLIDDPGEEYRHEVRAAVEVFPTVATSLRD